MYRMFSVFLLSLAFSTPALAQSTAINGTIEGTVKDEQGALLPGVTVTVANIDTGDQRVVVTNESGLYRAPLLPLGTYRVSAELQGFKKFEQTGVRLSAGQTAVINVALSVGAIAEVITVTADSPLVDLGKIEQGRTLTEAEIKTLPLTSRNPYNFALLQPGVVGFENQEFGVPRITANGALLRVNYQVDGSNNTEKDRAGIRQMPMSEVMIREVKVVTTGYAPEFGQTMGLIYNAITPSGTNTVKGQGAYRMQRRSFAAFPFFTQGARTSDRKPPTDVNIMTFDVGGPIVKDKTHFFGGYEHTERDLSGARVITITAANQALLGLTEPAYMPTALNAEFAIGKVDHQLNANHRLSFRYMLFDNFIFNNTGGALNSVQRASDFKDHQNSTGAQLISTLGSNVVNEFRFQYATRAQSRDPGQAAGSGPAVNISGVANIGGVTDGDFGFTENIMQFNNNTTMLKGDHALKAGVDVQHVTDTRTTTRSAQYTFPNAAAYLAAKNGTNPLGYTSFSQYLGLPDFAYKTNQYGMFIQDDWRLSSDLKLLYGVRYDLYQPPDASPDAPVASSRSFNASKSNWGPRAGVVWTMGRSKRAVLRVNSGLMYDQILNAMYEQALQNDGTNARVALGYTPTQAGAPPFPTILSAGAGVTPNVAWTVDPDFTIGHAWQNNVQFETALGQHHSVAAGTTFVKGYDLPVVTNINVINPTGTLPDGRKIFSTTVSAATRVDPRYNTINSTQSIGESTYKNLTLQFTRRNFNGIQWDFSYTLGKSEDIAPITGTLSIQGDAGRTDPTNLEIDRGPNVLDQRHTFTGSLVATPHVDTPNRVLNAIVNDNVLGVAMLFATGVPVNLRSNRELNNDGTASDRPNGATRNSLHLPARYNVDLRLSRRVRFGGSLAGEVIAELKNVFNTIQWSGVTATIATDTLGNAVSPLPTDARSLPPTGGYEQRQFQLGFKFSF